MSAVKIEQKTINKINKIIESGKPGDVVIKGVKVRIDPLQKVVNRGDEAVNIPITDEKTGGILPLVALIPLIAKAVAAVGTLAGGAAAATKVGYDIAKGGGLAIDSSGDASLDDKPPCTAKVIDAILTLNKAGFAIMRM